MHKVGTRVRQIVHPIEGVVKKLVTIDDGADVAHHVEFIGADGAKHERIFKTGEIDPVEPAATPKKGAAK